MKIIRLLCIGFLLCSGTQLLVAQTLQYENLLKVFMTDPSQLYYNYEMSFMEKGQLTEAVGNDEKIAKEIIAHYNESGWPAPLNDFDWRKKNKGVLINLICYHITRVGGFLSVLVVPKSENENTLKNAGVTLTSDIYMLIPTEFTKNMY